MESPISEVVSSLPPGFRFHATDEELLLNYLKPKILRQTDGHYYDIIPEIDVGKLEPWQLPSLSGPIFDGKELVFFCHLKRKYSNSSRSDRTTKAGYWKPTGKTRAIMGEDTDAQIGIKKTLVYHEGRMPNGKRTDWIMHECHLNPKSLGDNHDENEMLPYVVCRIKNKKDKKLMTNYTNNGNVSETPVNQEGDYSSSRDRLNNEVADNHEAVNAQPKMSAEELTKLLPSLKPLNGILSDYNTTPTYWPQAGAEDISLSSFDFLYNNSFNDYGYVPSPLSNFDSDWGNAEDFTTTNDNG